MTEQELLVDCLRRLNREGIAYVLTEFRVTDVLEDLLAGKFSPKTT